MYTTNSVKNLNQEWLKNSIENAQGYTAVHIHTPLKGENMAKCVYHAFGDNNNNNIDRARFIQTGSEPPEMK